ncbi:hypothetical protein QRE66_03875 [Bacillus cereus]|uniref:hypothetical protein n=1 Tax=Bacillus pseudomycoides TaxID=64104 RepID=UPI001145AD08|nr:hypothetical protein [Bacillus pseudomycoides]WJE53435.1 hypothetical protein QRE66_03875 [Bacillus cereus]
MKVLLREDIANRWAVSKERVQELALDPMFPKPYMILPSEENLYLETDIIAYEMLHVELTRVHIRGRNLRLFL